MPYKTIKVKGQNWHFRDSSGHKRDRTACVKYVEE